MMVVTSYMTMVEGDMYHHPYWRHQVSKPEFEIDAKAGPDNETSSTISIDCWRKVDSPSPVAESSYETSSGDECSNFEEKEMAAAKVLLDLGRVHKRKDAEEDIPPLQSSLSVPSLPSLLKDSPPPPPESFLSYKPYYNPLSFAHPLFLSTPDVHAYSNSEHRHHHPRPRYVSDDAYLSPPRYRPDDARAHSCHNIFAQADPLRASVFVNKISLDKDYYIPKFSIGTQTEDPEAQPLDLSMSGFAARAARKARSHSLTCEALRRSPYDRPVHKSVNNSGLPCSDLTRYRLENQVLRKKIKMLEEKLNQERLRNAVK